MPTASYWVDRALGEVHLTRAKQEILADTPESGR